REAGIVSTDTGVGGLEALFPLRNLLDFSRSFHKRSPVGGLPSLRTKNRRLRCAVPAVATRAQGRRFRALPLAWLAPDKVQRFEPTSGPVARTFAIGLTRLCRRSIKPVKPAPAVLARPRLNEVRALASRPPFRCPG